MSECKPKTLPCDLSINNLIENGSKELADANLYRQMIGSLIYVMTGTRPDLCFVVNKLSQHMSNPTTTHLSLAKHVFRYIKGTLDFKMKFHRSSGPLQLSGFCDSDWGG